MSRLRFFLSEAWEIQTRDAAGALASLTGLTAVLFLLAIVLLAGLNIRGLARNLESRKGIEVFLSDGIGPGRIDELAEIFRSFGEVEAVVFVSRDESLRQIQEDLGGVDVVSVLGENPLAHSFHVRLKPEAASRPGKLQEIAGEIGGYDGVEEVIDGGSWVGALERGMRDLYFATAGAAILAGLAVILVLWNTIKLAFLRRHETIKILRIVGASSSFLRFPYLLLGAFQSAAAALLALLLAAAIRLAIVQLMPGLRFFPPAWAAAFLIGACLLGLIASYASIEPALRNLERRSDAVTS